mmetsp:Transcript_42882/g.63105  ORF Transcript_42882/g.63105 Transcript_42882/m.63105 type:complete len:89 (+) Transcript_42882:3-269(+)
MSCHVCDVTLCGALRDMQHVMWFTRRPCVLRCISCDVMSCVSCVSCDLTAHRGPCVLRCISCECAAYHVNVNEIHLHMSTWCAPSMCV